MDGGTYNFAVDGLFFPRHCRVHDRLRRLGVLAQEGTRIIAIETMDVGSAPADFDFGLTGQGDRENRSSSVMQVRPAAAQSSNRAPTEPIIGSRLRSTSRSRRRMSTFQCGSRR